jgi:hypothetical protein
MNATAPHPVPVDSSPLALGVLVPPTAEMRRWADRLAPLLRPGSWLGTALVTPIAHVANDSLQFQAYLYAIFHRTAPARIVHALLMPAMLVALFAWIALGSAWASYGAAALLMAWYGALALRHGMPLFGAVAAVSVLPMVAAGQAWAHAVAAGQGGGLHPAWVLLGLGLAQSLSHGAEPDVPPRVTGSDRWVAVGTYFRTHTLGRLARAGAMAFAGAANELWASWRLWPVVVLDGLWRLGYRRDDRAELAALVERSLAHRNPAIDYIGDGGACTGRYP